MNENALEKIKNSELVKEETYSSSDLKLIKDSCAKGVTNAEFELFLYTAKALGLNPLLGQIWCVKYGKDPAKIYAGRDGFLEIAHRSGQFNGMDSGYKYDEKGNLQGWCKVYRKDMEHPFGVEVDLNEYAINTNIWRTKPKTMIAKVAESQCLRKAFRISGVYSQEEMAIWEEEAKKRANMPTESVENEDDYIEEVITDEEINKLKDLIERSKVDFNKAVIAIQLEFKVNKLEDLKKYQFEDLVNRIYAKHPELVENIPERIEVAEEKEAEEKEIKQDAGTSNFITEKQMKRMFAIAKQSGITEEEINSLIKKMFDLDSKKELNQEQYEKLCNMIEDKPITEEEKDKIFKEDLAKREAERKAIAEKIRAEKGAK